MVHLSYFVIVGSLIYKLQLDRPKSTTRQHSMYTIVVTAGFFDSSSSKIQEAEQVHVFSTSIAPRMNLNNLTKITWHTCSNENIALVTFLVSGEISASQDLIIGLDKEYQELAQSVVKLSHSVEFIEAQEELKVHFHFDQFFNASPGLYLVLDLKLNIVAVTDAYAHATNTERSMMLHKNIFDVFPDNPNDATATGISNLKRSLESVIETGKCHTVHIQKYDIRKSLYSNDFEVRYWRSKNFPIFIHGKLQYLLHSAEDVTEYMLLTQPNEQDSNSFNVTTEQKDVEISHRKQGHELRNMFCDQKLLFKHFTEVLPVGFFVGNAQKEIVYLNTFIKKLCNCDSSSNLHEVFMSSIHENDKNDLEQQLFRHSSSVTFRLFQNNTTTWVLSNCIAEFDDCYNVKSYVGSLTDITSLMECEKKKSCAQMASLKKNFETFCHEIRNPIHCILASVEEAKQVLHNESTSDCKKVEQLAAIFDVVQENSEYQNELASNLLELSKLDQKKLQINNAPFTLEEIIRQVSTQFNSKIKARNLHLILHITNGSIKLISDVQKLKQVLVNILSNAIKFSSKSSTITIDAVYNSASSTLAIQIQDSGIGISQQDQQVLFSRFVNINKFHDSVECTGLGLSISKEMIELLHGSITVRSELKSGCIFTIELPVMQCDVLKQTNECLTVATEKKYILVAEDNVVNRRIVSKMLDKLEYKYTITCNGEEAVKAARNQNFDTIFLDVGMPIMSGIEAAKEIRKINSQVSIIGMTGYSSDEILQEFKEVGVTEILFKPFTIEQFARFTKRNE